jgi:hypothetical protein
MTALGDLWSPITPAYIRYRHVLSEPILTSELSMSRKGQELAVGESTECGQWPDR